MRNSRFWLEDELDRAAAANFNPGRTEAFHRLSRTEYRNAIRDLFDLDVNVEELLPADDTSYGFDNIAGVLGVSPTSNGSVFGGCAKNQSIGRGVPGAVAYG